MIKTSDLCVDCIYKLLRLTVFLMIDFYPIVNLYNTKYYRLSIKFVCCDKKLKDQLLMYMLVLSIYQCTAKKNFFFSANWHILIENAIYKTVRIWPLLNHTAYINKMSFCWSKYEKCNNSMTNYDICKFNMSGWNLLLMTINW